MGYSSDTERYFCEQRALCEANDQIRPELFKELGVKAGLRDENGNGVLTVISFDYVVPSPIAFFHAFVMYCNQGTVINKDSEWIGIGRTDKT